MATKSGERILRAALSAAVAARLTDAELLQRFIDGNEAAFEVLVKRYDSMVLGVCRRVLPTLQDAEDACQATFLVLSRKAKTGRWQASIANWLYTIARRVALNASRTAARRSKREGRPVPPPTVSALDQMTGREAFAALDEELGKLAPIYREPLVLCYLQGLTRDEAALRLGIPVATLKSQLDRGRKKLADALTKRGIVVGIGLIAVAATSSASACSPRLVESILATVGGSPSPSVAALALEVTVNGVLSKGKWLLLALVAAAVSGVGFSSMPIAARPHKAALEKPEQQRAKPMDKQAEKQQP
jgi:RNA polymerase sigma factor (sigma-70 family)